MQGARLTGQKGTDFIIIIQLPFSMLSVNCDSYKVAIIWAIITTEVEGSLNRKLGS